MNTSADQSFHSDAFVPDQEPGLVAASHKAGEGEAPIPGHQPPSLVGENILHWSIGDKFILVPSKFKDGAPYLQPRDDYFVQIREDIILFSQCWLEKLDGEDIARRAKEVMSIVETAKADDGSQDIEERAVYRWLSDRAILNAHFAADTQWEMDRYSDRETAAGRDPNDREDFIEKKDKRDHFMQQANTLFAVAREVLPAHLQLTNEVYIKAQTNRVYNNAKFNSNRRSQPISQSEDTQHKQEAARMTNRPAI